jgi:GT2 family glycosyltransferase
VFFEIGGFSEELPINFNDVDFSLKVRQAGYRILWISRARLYHFESRTREARVEQFEVDRIRARWGVPGNDPFVHLRTRTVMRRERAGL